MDDSQYIEEVCSKCKNKNKDICHITQRVDGTYSCEHEEIEEESKDEI